MDVKDWIAEVMNPLKTLRNFGLLLDEQDITTRREKRTCRIGFPQSSFEEAMPVSKLDFGSLEEYMQQLRFRNYSALLTDGSFLQISLDVERDDLVKHRYCYYPCPVNFENDELRLFIEEEPVADVIETFLSGPQPALLLRSPVRFDFDSTRWKSGEPHAHVHLNHRDCRCAISAPILPSYFVKFIIRHFYPHFWQSHTDLELLSQEMIGYWLKDEEPQFLHLTAQKGSPV